MSRYTPDNITSLRANEIFTFGSNAQGHHAGGAARIAVEKFGAVWGRGEGLQGQSCAIPTMEGPERLAAAVTRFLKLARSRPDLTFYVTKIGCGIAGYQPQQVAPLFAGHPGNVITPREFADIIKEAHQ